MARAFPCVLTLHAYCGCPEVRIRSRCSKVLRRASLCRAAIETSGFSIDYHPGLGKPETIKPPKKNGSPPFGLLRATAVSRVEQGAP